MLCLVCVASLASAQNRLFSVRSNQAGTDSSQGSTSANPGNPVYLDVTKPLEARVEDALSRMTLEEKVALCHGKRFKQDLLDVHYRDNDIADILELTVDQAIAFFGEKPGQVEKKIIKRLKPLQDVGLGYVKLGQSSSTLSGGESQRVKLAYFLSTEHPEPTIYVFDEPSTGLHFHDIRMLLKAFDALIEKGHTVIIIEHNMEIIKNADHVIDLGPEGGNQGGYLVFEGTPEALAKCKDSYTGRFLKDHIKN